MFLAHRLVLFALSLLIIGGAEAQPADSQLFVADRGCPATRSIAGDDPVAPAVLEAGRSYAFVSANKEPATHYQIVVPGAEPERRWVERACGRRVAPVSEERSAPARAARSPSTNNLLALSWQPAFCEGQSRRPECRSQTADRPDASRFSLHGLWPQPRGREYCGEAAAYKDKRRSRDWADLPAVGLSPELKTRLDAGMPGTRSLLDRHEWARHGSCYGGDAEEYYAESLDLLDAVNASPVAKLFAERIGREVTAREIRAAFDAGFGTGAGERVRIACRDDGGRRLVGELTIGLVGEIGPRPDVGRLIRAARPTDAGCPGGIVDPAGLQ
jgi:ribonuclease T2